MADSGQTWLGTSDRYARLRRIETLDIATHQREIMMLTSADFQSVMLPLAFSQLMMTYAAPRMSKILFATGELEKRVAKRMVDTALLSRAVMEHGFEGPGRTAAKRVNAMHSKYEIHQDDFTAVGVDTALVTIRLIDAYGWRPMIDKERRAICLFYADQTRAFGGRNPFPDTIEEMEAFWAHYAETQLAFEPQNLALTNAMLKWSKTILPRALGPFFRKMLLSLIDPRIVRACGVKVPFAPMRWAAHVTMRQMGQRDPTPDGAPNRTELFAGGVYPNGYEIDKLGTHLPPAPVVAHPVT